MQSQKTIIPLRILIVEDDPDILNALSIVLGSRGFDVDVMLKGKSILKNLFVKPDLFILDKRLPDVDGLDICRYLKSSANYKHIPVVVISASAQTRTKALEAGASLFIEKPFDLQEFVDAITNAIAEKGTLH